MQSKDIGIDVKSPKNKCEDKNCPFHGSLTCRGRLFTGTIVSDKMHKTVVAEWIRRYYIKKYERYDKRRTKLKVHNPPCINAKEGDMVSIMECRPLSKTKNFVIVENFGREKGFAERTEALEEAKFQAKSKKPEEEVKEKS